MILTDYMRKILDISIALTAEKDYNRLLENILEMSMDITASDAGTLYIMTEQGLKFMIMHNKTMQVYQGGRGEEIDLPPVELAAENICAYSALHKKVINIEDVYHSELFDFNGPKKYDKITGYHTRSMLVLPLESHEGDILGVLQLINAQDKDKNVIAFDKSYEYIIYSIASQAAVSLANMNHMKDMRTLLYSTVAAFTKAIDERTPYNANHTMNVARYTAEFAEYLNRVHEASKDGGCFFSPAQAEQLNMAARLHDVGKLVVPLEVMNKETRLGNGGLCRIENRFALIRAYLKIDFLEKRITKEQWELAAKEIDEGLELVRQADSIPFLQDETIERLEKLGEKRYEGIEGIDIPYLTEEEKEDFKIRKGTLTAKERKIMENHVEVTSTILKEIKFGKDYDKVRFFAGAHHEYLDGTGYPDKLRGEELPIEVRMLTIADIFDSLISTDRPYKKPMPVAKALGILKEMADEGKLDKELVEKFCDFGEQYA